MLYPDPARVIDLLDALLDFFGPYGEHWLRDAYDDERGNRCLAAAVEDIECEHNSIGCGLTHYLGKAIWPRRNGD